MRLTTPTMWGSKEAIDKLKLTLQAYLTERESQQRRKRERRSWTNVKDNGHLLLERLKLLLRQAETVLRKVGGESDDARVIRSRKTLLLEGVGNAKASIFIVLRTDEGVDLLDVRLGK
jgi:hypothetical protein